MAKFERMMQNERRLQALTGLNQAGFETLLPHFAKAMEQYLLHTTLDGYQREGDRAVTYTNSPLPTATDRLLFILSYLKLNHIQEAHGHMFEMSQSNVSKWVRLLLEILTAALAEQHLLPARTAAELAAYLRSIETTTEEATPVEPDAVTGPLFTKTGLSDQSLVLSTPMSSRSTTAANEKRTRSKT